MLVTEHCTAIVFVCILYLKWVIGSGIGPCPKLNVTGPPLNISQLTGHWYEIERSFHIMELITTCVTMDISQTVKGRLEVVVSTKSSWTGTFSINDGIAVPTRRDPGTYLYRVSSRLPRILSRHLPGAGYYQVLKTDYINYAIVYSCTNYQLFHIDQLWIFGRKNEIDAGLRMDLYAVLAAHNFDSERLVLSKSGNCTEDHFDDLFDDYS